MQKVEKEKGITLIALVVTIIVLLILAGVTIIMLSGDNGILNKATEAKLMTDKGKKEEKIKITRMEALSNLKGTTHKEKIIKKNAQNEEEVELTVPIPAGFAESQIEGEKSIKSGLVIMDSEGNEFVWVPLKDEDINTMIMCKSHTNSSDCDIAKNETTGKLYCKNHQGTEICGKLYADGMGNNFGTLLQTYNANNYQREPGVVTGDFAGTGSYYDASNYPATINSNWTSSAKMLEGLQEDFEKMALSVYENKGFYIARYETSLDSNKKKVQSKPGVLSASAETTSANRWYGFYRLQRSYDNTYVGSNMMWGCQYDQMMFWMRENGINVKSNSYGKAELQYAQKNPATSSSTCITGVEGDKDILNNVYDLLGCRWEWCAEATSSSVRVVRGSDWNGTHSPSTRTYQTPTVYDERYGSRFALYIKK